MATRDELRANAAVQALPEKLQELVDQNESLVTQLRLIEVGLDQVVVALGGIEEAIRGKDTA